MEGSLLHFEALSSWVRFNVMMKFHHYFLPYKNAKAGEK
jgi:hypothetical protein